MPGMTVVPFFFDVRSAWKGVRRGGLASLTAVVALAVGVAGAVTAGVVGYAGLVRPLPFPRAADIVTLRKMYTPTAVESGIKLSQFDEWRGRLGDSAQVAAYTRESATIVDGAAPREIAATYTVGPFFDLFGVPAEYGRTFSEDDGVDVAIVSHGYAASLPGGPTAVLDRWISLAGRPLRIVGIMPRSFGVLGDTDVWTPARGVHTLRVLGPADARDYIVVARLRGRTSLAAFRDAAHTLVQESVAATQRANSHARVTPLRDELLGDSRPVLLVFAGASGLVLLIACANVSMLLVNMVLSRTREFAVRLALGASRTRVLRTVAVETALLVIAGGSAGWWLSIVATSALRTQTALNLPPLAITFDAWRIGVGVLVACAFIVLACSTAPLLMVRDARLSTPLRAGASTGSPNGRRLRSALVVAQLATAIVLLVGAGLLGKTMWVLSHMNIGLDGARDSVVTMALPVGQGSAGTDPATRAAITARILEAVRRLPGVETAGVGSSLPPSGSQILFTVRVTTSNDDRDVTRKFDLVSATSGYLEALGARLLQGRLFTEGDAATDQPVVVLSQSAVEHLGLTSQIVDRKLNMALPSASGQRVRPRIVGVIQDIRYTGLDAPANGGFYVLWRQIPTARAHLVIRTAGDGRALVSSLLPVVRAVDPALPLREPQRFEDVVDEALAPRTARFGLVGIFATAALLLGVVGLGGALMRSVTERQRDLAVRAALGAAPERLVRLVLGHGLLLAITGSGLGVIAAGIAARAASNVIFGVTPYDRVIYAGAVGCVFAVTLAACYIPARRAAATDPILLLRSE
jgi:putative ABC transport system permease protein